MNADTRTSFARRLEGALSCDEVNDLGRSVGFVHRLRVVTPFRLVVSLVCALASFKVVSIADLLRAFNHFTGTSTAYKAFYNRLARPGFPRLMRAMLERCLSQLAVETLEFEAGTPLTRFRDIRIQDGTSFAVKSALSETFPGRFTTIEPAAVELHVNYSARRDEAVQVTLTPDSSSERGELPPAAELADCLVLGDRGYPATDYFLELDRAGGYYLMRLTSTWRPRVHGLITRNGSVHPLDKPVPLQQFLAQNQGRVLDVIISLSRDKHRARFRLVLFPNTSRRKVKKPAKKDPWVRLCTNLSARDFPARQVGLLYRFRWQVELLFKEWKSYANLHRFDTANPHIAEGLIWASLCAATIKRFVAHATQRVTGEPASTRRTASCASYFLPELARVLVVGDRVGFRRVWRRLTEFIDNNARRSNPRRDQEKGRLQAGLRVAVAS